MRISGDEYLRAALSSAQSVRRASRAFENSNVTTARVAQPAPAAAQVEFSTEAREAQRVAEAARKAPDVRDDIVAELKQKIENGSYHVSGEQIGEMMIRRMLADRIV